MKRLIIRLSIVIGLVLIITSIFTLPAAALEPGEPGYIGEFCHDSAPGLDTDQALEPGELGTAISIMASSAPNVWSDWVLSRAPVP